MKGSLIFKATDESYLKAAARNNFGALVALQDLSPLTVSAINPTADALLAALWQSTRATDYAAWQADKGATPSTFTDQWIADRTTLLTAITARNIKYGDGVAYSSALPTDQAYDLHWIDASGPEQILIAENTTRQGGVLRPVALQRFSFGNDGNNLLSAPTTSSKTTSTAALATTP